MGVAVFLEVLVSVNQIVLHHTLKDQLLNIRPTCEIVGFCSGVFEVFTLVECCAPLVISLLLTFWNNISVLLCQQQIINQHHAASQKSEGFTTVASLYAPQTYLYGNENCCHHYTLCDYMLVILLCFFNFSIWSKVMLSWLFHSDELPCLNHSSRQGIVTFFIFFLVLHWLGNNFSYILI